MPDTALVAEHHRARDAYTRASRELVPLLIRVTLERMADLLPGTHELEVAGRINGDWIPNLRIQRALDEQGAVRVDIGFSHDDPAVENGIDEVDTEYLDLLLDLTGDDFMGHRRIDRTKIGLS